MSTRGSVGGQERGPERRADRRKVSPSLKERLPADRAGMPSANGAEKAAQVREMFARIVSDYDTVNSVMTFGRDRAWRRAAVGAVAPAGARVLDAATGTGELASELCRQGCASVVALDFCLDMVKVARLKVERIGVGAKVAFAGGDAQRLPFPDGAFDAVINGFLLRNLTDIAAALREFHRVLKPGGRLACLDVTHPPGLLRPLCLLYFDAIVPLIGGILSGDFAAYRYLPRSLDGFPDAERLAAMIAEAGLGEVNVQRFNFGMVALHTARKPMTSA